MKRIALVITALFIIVSAVWSAEPADPSVSLTVFAAASLTESFGEMAAAFEATHPEVKVELNLSSSNQLALQINEGAPADVYASANLKNMDKVVAAGLIDAGQVAVFANNLLVAVVPAANPGEIETLRDLARPGLKIVLAGKEVPVGAYSFQAIDLLGGDPEYGAGYKDALLKNVVSHEDTVKHVLTKVLLGEADAGIVYRSDVTPSASERVRMIEIPERFNVLASYPIAVLNRASGNETATGFVQFVLSPSGREILAKWGLIPPIE